MEDNTGYELALEDGSARQRKAEEEEAEEEEEEEEEEEQRGMKTRARD